MLKGKGKNKGFGKGKNPPLQQTLCRMSNSGYGKDWIWNDPWTDSWKGKSRVHSVEEQCAWQSGDGTTVFWTGSEDVNHGGASEQGRDFAE